MTTNGTPSHAAAAGTFQLGDMTVNRMGFGAMRVTGEGIWGMPKDKENAKAVLRRAVELGVNLIDTADASGKTKVVVDVAGKKVTIAAEGDIELSAPQGTVRISGQSVEISSSAAMKIAATGTLDVQGQTVNVKGQPLINLN